MFVVAACFQRYRVLPRCCRIIAGIRVLVLLFVVAVLVPYVLDDGEEKSFLCFSHESVVPLACVSCEPA
jgi:hypothetical protein